MLKIAEDLTKNITQISADKHSNKQTNVLRSESDPKSCALLHIVHHSLYVLFTIYKHALHHSPPFILQQKRTCQKMTTISNEL